MIDVENSKIAITCKGGGGVDERRTGRFRKRSELMETLDLILGLLALSGSLFGKASVGVLCLERRSRGF